MPYVWIAIVFVLIGFGSGFVKGRFDRKRERKVLEQERQNAIKDKKELLDILRTGREPEDCLQGMRLNWEDRDDLDHFLKYYSDTKKQELPFDFRWIGTNKEELSYLLKRFQHITQARLWLKAIRDPKERGTEGWENLAKWFAEEMKYFSNEKHFGDETKHVTLGLEFFGTSEKELDKLQKEHEECKVKNLLNVIIDDANKILTNHETMFGIQKKHNPDFDPLISGDTSLFTLLAACKTFVDSHEKEPAALEPEKKE